MVTIMQLFVGEDGFVGSLLEHSAADGPAAIVIDVFTLDLLYVMHHNNNIVLWAQKLTGRLCGCGL